MLQTKNLKIHLRKDGKLLIDNFNFTLGRGDKVAVIGEEGNGKSALLKLLYGTPPDFITYSGTIIRKGNFGYLPQFLPETERRKTVAEFLTDTDIYAEYRLIERLGVDFGMLVSEQKTDTLSGGEKVKIQLIKCLSGKPDALFLDEPSNDLDIETLEFLENLIRASDIPIIFVSHDETLIAETANTIIHIEQLIKKTEPKVTISRTPYKAYSAARENEFDNNTRIALKERAQYKKQLERLSRLYEKAKRNTSWKNPDGIPSSDGRAKKSMQSAVTKIKLAEKEREKFTEIPDRETAIITRFDDNITLPCRKTILDFYLPALTAGEKRLAENIRLTVTGPEHICIIGKNGAGKSALLKTIYSELVHRKDLNVGYMPQNYADVLPFEKTPAEFLAADFDKTAQTRAMTMLGNMKFTTREMNGKIKDLSGGQQAKLIFLNMVLTSANVLILDEPTRNFSPLSAPAVRKALSDFGGAVIAVSHDRNYLKENDGPIYMLNEKGLSLL